MKLSVFTPTHDPRWLSETWASIRAQTHADWEWIVTANGAVTVDGIRTIIGADSRVRVFRDPAPHRGVGARKAAACWLAEGDVLVELDHDDLLAPQALTEIAEAFADPEIGFAYSDWADFADDGRPQGEPTYRQPAVRRGWEASGYQFYMQQIGGVRPGIYECVRGLSASARTLSSIYWAPNHVRAWRTSVYRQIGGHDPRLPLCDDHELMIRTYLTTKFKHIPRPLYLYRITGANTWAGHVDEIRRLTDGLRDRWASRLAERDASRT